MAVVERDGHGMSTPADAVSLPEEGPVLRTALVGFGGIARGLHVRLLHALPEFRITAVVARSDASAESAAQALPHAALHRSVDDLLAAVEGERPGGRDRQGRRPRRFGLALLAAGIPTVIEKPLAPTADDAERLQAAARAAGVPVVAFQNKRWDRDYAAVAAAVRGGEVGEVLRFEAWLVRWSPGIWDNLREEARPGTLDGPLADIGSHLVDQAVALLGPVRSVTAELDARRPGTQVADDEFLRCCTSPALAAICTSGRSPPGRCRRSWSRAPRRRSSPPGRTASSRRSSTASARSIRAGGPSTPGRRVGTPAARPGPSRSPDR